MSHQRENLIKDLSQELAPVVKPGRILGRTAAWLLLSIGFVVAAMSLFDPFRSGWFEQLLTSPLFMLESLTGLFAIIGLGGVIFQLGIPGYPRVALHTGLALLGLSAWIGFFLFGLQHPALEPSMAGKREECYYQVLLYSIPPILTAAFLLRSLAVTRPLWVGAISGIVAGAIPAWLMQIGCMYIPEHILSHHIAPMGGTMLLGLCVFWIVSRRAN